MQIKMIWAQARDGQGRPVIGKGGVMPWHLPEDMAHFKAQTAGCPVIMGRKTWYSLPERFRPLPGRLNIVVSRQAGMASQLQGVKVDAEGRILNDSPVLPSISLHSSLQSCEQIQAPVAWIMGGGELYAQGMALAHELVVTKLDATFEGDTFAPEVGPEWQLARREPADGFAVSKTGLSYAFHFYERRKVSVA
jgi:dihydrofolate reductase